MRSGGAKLIATVLISLLLVGLSFKPIRDAINLGLDLQGGLHVVLEAKPSPDNPITDDTMVRTKEVLERRVNETGVKEPDIRVAGKDRIIVELAGVKDPEEAIKMIGKTAVLQFKTADGKVVLTGTDLKDARAQFDQYNQPEIALQFTKEGANKFADVTRANIGKEIGIYLDEKLLTNPTVQVAITNGQATITGSASYEEANNTAALLRGGALPVKLDFVEKRIVGPTLGADSLEKSKVAGVIGLAAIFVFMLAFYRLPGLIACFTLIVYSAIVLGVMAAMGAVLTLPGIAGFLLSIGMAVDANIIIFERMKEELRAGRTLRKSIESGFDRAIITVMDANITTIIASVILMYLGTGPIRGFAVTLTIGIVASMLTAIIMTRYLLRWIADTSLTNTKLYGAGGKH